MKKIILYFVAVLSLAGCATYSYTDAPPTLGVMYSKYVQIGYEGNLKQIDDVGIITTDGVVKVQSINGKPMTNFRLFKTRGVYSGGRYQLHLFPGDYEIGMSFHFDKGAGYRAWSTSNLSRTVTVTKGQVLHLSWIDQGIVWDVRVSDGISALSAVKGDFNELTADKN